METREPVGTNGNGRKTRGRATTESELRTLLEALRAIGAGDFSVRLPVKRRNGVLDELARAFNDVAKRGEYVTSEIVRLEQVVGREGRMHERVAIGELEGAWATKLQKVNQLVADLVQPTTEIARVLTSVAQGDLSQKMALEFEHQPVRGEFLRIGTTVNTMVDQLRSFAGEVTRVAKEVGTEGKLGGQAEVRGVSGTWKDLTDNVNSMAANLTDQVRNIAEVSTAVAKGDLSKKITVSAKGEILELKNTVNTMVDQLNSFAAEVTRVAKEVGTEGKLGGQAEVKGVSGTWKDLTDNVNFMAANLTTQVRGIARVVTAVANGDLTLRLRVEAKGEIAALAETINNMCETLGIFAEQVTDVARTVGVEGKLGAQAQVPGVAGTWKDLTENVNLLANNLTAQVRNIAEVTTAVALGDLSRKITVDVKGEILELKNTINTMVDQLRSFAGEVTRVAKEVGTEGKLGGQADVRGVSGVWKDLTDNVNGLAGNLTDQVRNIAKVTTAVADGDLSQKITVEARGEILALKNTINTMVDQLNSFAGEVTRVAKEVGTEGRLGGQAQVKNVSGVWKDLTDNVNVLAGNLTDQVRNIAKVTTAVANGDLSQKITVEARGEVLQLKETVNTMVDQLRSFAGEVTRVAKEVGSEGKLGGQADVKGVSGVWKDLTDNVNFMARNLTDQVRNIAKVSIAIANGDLSQKIAVEAQGEILELKNTINIMVDQLRSFAGEVTRVAKEVGIEGKLGGQAKVQGATGTWRQLTDNVNQLAASLTTQIRAIAEVATAVTKGDLTRSISVEAAGEVAALKDNINQMIVNLRETTQKNMEQDWLKTNLARFSGMMQGQKNLDAVARLIMSELTPLVGAHHGVFFMTDAEGALKLTSSYAYRERKNVSSKFRPGESLIGQCALEKKPILLTRVPGDYVTISSGLGEAPPLNIIVLPVLFEGEVKAVIELASFHPFSAIHQIFLDQLTESIGVVLNMISANMRTEELLLQSQSLTQELQSQSRELQSQQEELKRTNSHLETQAQELEDKARLLEEQKTKVEEKNREVEAARTSLEEKAEQLALISKYKSEFLANMSHELRTPLNSLLILAKLLADNKDGNLSGKQVEYAQTIHSSGGDLLTLINEILDLSKVEAGKMHVEPRDIVLGELEALVHRSFGALAAQKGLELQTDLAHAPERIRTDPQRLQQVLKNLLANAFKFTEKGFVRLTIREVADGAHFESVSLNTAHRVVAFEVKDSGIGIPREKQRLIFEAFQQADGSTARKYGGTGLGLSISREIARLLGGEVRLESAPGAGSTFTLFLPDEYRAPEAPEGMALDPSEPTIAPERVLRESERVRDQRAPEGGVEPVRALEGKTVLLVDDDVRNIFALTSVLEDQHMKVLYAENGRAAINVLNEAPHVDVILMDLMMPEMDGYHTMRAIRQDPRFRALPIIAITAKALREDHDKSIEAGASDYLPKPIDIDRLIEILKLWLEQ